MRCRNRLWPYTPKFVAFAIGLLLSGLTFVQQALAQEEPALASSIASSSAASSAPPEKPLYADTLERDNALLIKAFTALAQADELQWLDTPNEKILTLYKTAETRKPKGVLMIMHAPETPQLWPSNLENLRRHIPLTGWATMALPLPAKYPVVIPERASSSSSASASSAMAEGESATPAAAEPLATADTGELASSSASSILSSASSSSAKPVIARDILIAERVEAAVAHLNSVGQFNLVVLVDNSSAPYALTGLYQKINTGTTTADLVDGPLQALILVNLQEQEPLTKAQLQTIFSVSNLPIMDVFFSPDDNAQKIVRRSHQAEAMRQNIKDYQQFILPTQPEVVIDDTKSFWLGKIHGFMERKAEGGEVKGSKTKP